MAGSDGVTPRPDVVTGLSASDLALPISDYFATFRWELPLFDPKCLSVSAFFAMVLDDAEDISASGSVNPRYLDSVDVELLDEIAGPPPSLS